MTKIPYYYALPAILISTLLATAVILAWQEPTASPPGDNVPTPLNVSRFGQAKIGGLILNTGGTATSSGLVVDNGRVGIGTRDPEQTLDVEGTAKMAGFQLPTNAGLNKFLVSDALGFGTWQARAQGSGNNIVTTRAYPSKDNSGCKDAQPGSERGYPPPFCPSGWSIVDSWKFYIQETGGGLNETRTWNCWTQTLCTQ